MEKIIKILILILLLAGCAKRRMSDEELEAGKKELLWAVECGEKEKIKELLILGIDINIKNKYGKTPLHLAISKRNIYTAKLLIDNGADINAKDNLGKTPFHHAYNEESICLLVNTGADINAKDNNGYTRLDYTYNGRKNSASSLHAILKNYGAEYSEKNSIELVDAVLRMDIEKVKKLLENGADPNARIHGGATPLLAAANPYQAMNQRAVRIDKEKQVKLREIARILVDKGADINKTKVHVSSLLHAAAGCGNTAVAKFLVEAGADWREKDHWGKLPVYDAAEHGSRETVEYFLSLEGEDVAEKIDLNILLHRAAAYNGVDVVQLLLEKGANVNSRDSSGRTPLGNAVRYYMNRLVMKFLIENGANVNSKDNEGQTPMHYAMYSNHIMLCKEGAEILLNSGVDVNAQDNQGNTSIHIMAKRGSKELVQYLLNNKANINIVNSEGKTPLDTAIINEKKEDFIKFLRSLGAKTGKELQEEEK